jgi:hypothetical protein
VNQARFKPFVALAVRRGYKPPSSPSSLDLLARELSRVAREQHKTDELTGRPYRVYHAYKQAQGDRQLTLWIDIDTAPRGKMHKSLQMRREQMVGDGFQLTLDADHWNGRHPSEEPIDIPLDFTEDVAERKNVPDEHVA